MGRTKLRQSGGERISIISITSSFRPLIRVNWQQSSAWTQQDSFTAASLFFNRTTSRSPPADTWLNKCQLNVFKRWYSFIMGSSHSTNACTSVQVSSKFGFYWLFYYINSWWDVWIDSWDWDTINQGGVSASSGQCSSSPYSLLSRLWLQIGSVQVQDIFSYTSELWEEAQTRCPSS